MKAKRFGAGDRVEVQAKVGAAWEPATYERLESQHTHGVRLERVRCIDAASGVEVGHPVPGCFKTTYVMVPSRRIREVPAISSRSKDSE